MSTTVIKPNAGTPFEQIVSISLKAASKPKPQTVINVPVPRPVAKVAVRAVKPKRTSPTPARTIQQRMHALQVANDVRGRRSQLKRDLKAGSESLTVLLLDPPAYLETAKVVDMLLAVPKYGRVKANKILRACAISPSKTIGGLSQRQRAELVELMEGRS